MKKTMKIFWLVCLVLSLCTLMFTACDEEEKPNDTNNTTDDGGSDEHVHAFGEWTVTEEATCTEKGEKERTCSCGEKEMEGIESLGHTEVIDAAVAPTCTAEGKTEGKHCSGCDLVFVEQSTISVMDHTYDNDEDEKCNVCDFVRDINCKHTSTEVIKAVSATCTASGLTEGKKCSKCGEILVAQKTVNKLGHKEVTDKSVAATCTKDGKTEGKHCSRCNVVLVAQTTVNKLGHVEVIDKAVDATCSSEGKTEGKHCSRCNTTLVAQKKISKLPHTEVIDKAVAATCTKTGLTEGKHCSVCNTVIKKQNTVPAAGHIFDNENDEKCNVCDAKNPNYVPTIETIDIGALTHTTTTIDKITHSSISIDAAVSETYNGNITKEGQKDVYTFTAPRDGKYLFAFSDMKASMSVGVYVYDELGNCVNSSDSIKNNGGLIVSLSANETYEIQVREYYHNFYDEARLGSYTLTIWHQKPTVDVTNYTIISDSIEYAYQRNKYTFTPSVSGTYLFAFSDMKASMSVGVYVYDELGNCVNSSDSIKNNGGLIVSLSANETYEIQVREYYHNFYDETRLGSYTLTIWHQKPTVDVSDYTIIKDSIEYAYQRNKYTFTPSVSGTYRFAFSDMKASMSVWVYVYDELGNCVNSSESISNDKGLTVSLSANETYEIQVREYYHNFYDETRLGSYTLTIWHQKPTTDVSSVVQIKDSIQYTDQENVYNFTADVAGTQTIKITGLSSSFYTKIYVYDNLDYTVASDTYFQNNDTIILKDLEIGTNYRIVVYQYKGKGNYTLTIE